MREAFNINHLKSALSGMLRQASVLDASGDYRQADQIESELYRKLAQVQGPNNLNIPLKNRVIPYSEMDSEFKEQDDMRNDHPRYHPNYYNIDDAGDSEDRDDSVFSLNNAADDVPGPKNIVNDTQSAGMQGGDLDSFEYEQRDKRNNADERYKNMLPH